VTAPTALTAWDLPTASATETARRERSTVIPVFLLAVLLPLDRLSAGGFPLSELAAGGICAWALTRRTTVPVRSSAWLVPVIALLPLVLAVSGLVNDVTAVRRMLHVLLWCGFVYLIAVGKVHLLSLARGLGVGLLVGLLSWFAGVDAGYGDRLTGWMADPNAAGMFFVGFGAIAVAFHRSWWARLGLVAVIVVGTVLTQSRTSLFALGMIGAVVLATRLLPRTPALAGSAVLAWVVQGRSEEFRTEGQFADREGSDLLRARIYEIEREDIALSPWIGNGPGTARVDLDGDTFFYHSSYLAIRAEGGWLVYAVMIAFVALAVVLLRRAPKGRTRSWVEAALAAVLVCALNLGEVLLAFPMAVALGAAFHLALHPAAATDARPTGTSPPPNPTETS